MRSSISLMGDVLTSMPFWLLFALLFCLRKIYRKRKEAKASGVSTPNLWYVLAVPLFLANVITMVTIVQAARYSGPISGQVVDAVTKVPMAGARVVVICRSTSSGLFRYPWYVAWLVYSQKEVSRVVFTNSEGRFNVGWFGPYVLKGRCEYDSLSATAVGYEYYFFPTHVEGVQIAHPAAAFSDHIIEMTMTGTKANPVQPGDN